MRANHSPLQFFGLIATVRRLASRVYANAAQAGTMASTTEANGASAHPLLVARSSSSDTGARRLVDRTGAAIDSKRTSRATVTTTTTTTWRIVESLQWSTGEDPRERARGRRELGGRAHQRHHPTDADHPDSPHPSRTRRLRFRGACRDEAGRDEAGRDQAGRDDVAHEDVGHEEAGDEEAGDEDAGDDGAPDDLGDHDAGRREAASGDAGCRDADVRNRRASDAARRDTADRDKPGRDNPRRDRTRRDAVDQGSVSSAVPSRPKPQAPSTSDLGRPPEEGKNCSMADARDRRARSGPSGGGAWSGGWSSAADDIRVRPVQRGTDGCRPRPRRTPAAGVREWLHQP